MVFFGGFSGKKLAYYPLTLIPRTEELAHAGQTNIMGKGISSTQR